MGSWHYAYLFPGDGDSFSPAEAIKPPLERGLHFDNSIFMAREVDEDGHLEYMLERSVGDSCDLESKVASGESFLVECRSKDIFFMIGFASSYKNPHISIAWPKRAFSGIGEAMQDDCWEMLLSIAVETHSDYVVFVDDPIDYFEDRFLDVGGVWVLEDTMADGTRYAIRGVWVKDGASLPQGVTLVANGGGGNGYLEYSVSR